MIHSFCLCAEAFERASCRILAAQAESEAESEREHDDQSAEEDLSEVLEYAELVESDHDREDPDCIAGDNAQHVGRVDADNFRSADNDFADRISDDRRKY